jgi:IS1 family transposase
MRMITIAAAILLVATQAHAQNLWDQPQNWTVETPTDHWTATARPMPDGSTQSIFNSDRGRYMLCTSRPMGNGRATISCD